MTFVVDSEAAKRKCDEGHVQRTLLEKLVLTAKMLFQGNQFGNFSRDFDVRVQVHKIKNQILFRNLDSPIRVSRSG